MRTAELIRVVEQVLDTRLLSLGSRQQPVEALLEFGEELFDRRVEFLESILAGRHIRNLRGLRAMIGLRGLDLRGTRSHIAENGHRRSGLCRSQFMLRDESAYVLLPRMQGARGRSGLYGLRRRSCLLEGRLFDCGGRYIGSQSGIDRLLRPCLPALLSLLEASPTLAIAARFIIATDPPAVALLFTTLPSFLGLLDRKERFDAAGGGVKIERVLFLNGSKAVANPAKLRIVAEVAPSFAT